MVPTHPVPRDENREAAAMRRIVLQFEASRALQSRVGALMLQSNGVGTAVIARHNVSLAANPLQIVRRGSCHGVRKKRKPVQLDVNGHCGWSFFRGPLSERNPEPRPLPNRNT